MTLPIGVQYLMDLEYAMMTQGEKDHLMTVLAPDFDTVPPEDVLTAFGGRDNFDAVIAHLKAIRDLIIVEG